jgi:hypothetical protein
LAKCRLAKCRSAKCRSAKRHSANYHAHTVSANRRSANRQDTENIAQIEAQPIFVKIKHYPYRWTKLLLNLGYFLTIQKVPKVAVITQ